MKQVTATVLMMFSMLMISTHIHAKESVYDRCVADAEMLIKIGKQDGATAARKYPQKTTVAACMKELAMIEAKYGEKTKGVNPYSVMTPDDRQKWATLFDAVDVKNFKGVRFLQAVYYR